MQTEHLLHFAKSCKDIVVYLQTHQQVYSHLQKALEKVNIPVLTAPSDTCWGSHLGCFGSLLKEEEVLQSIVTHQDFKGIGLCQQ